MPEPVATPDTESQWPSYLAGPADHYHALGVIAAMFNILEFRLLGLFLLYMGHTETIAWLFRRLSDNRLRIDLLTRAVEDKAETPEIKEALGCFMAGYSQCAENRNILMHSTTSVLPDIGLPETLVFNKATVQQPLQPNRFVIDRDALRRVADEMSDLSQYGLHIYRHVISVHREEELLGPTRLPDYTPLPDKPSPPKKLNPQELPKLKADPAEC